MLSVKSGRGALTALAVAIVAGCSGGGGSVATPEPAFDGDLSTVLTVEIRNDRDSDSRIELWIDRKSMRLGTVPAFSSRTFHIPLDAPAEIYMQFNITLGPRCVTAPVTLAPGEAVTALITFNLNMMAARCR